VQLEQAREGFLNKGLAVAAISYDSPAILLNFANRSAIHYPLLADQGSTVIRAFGLLNTQLPENNQNYGVPYPGMYIVDAQGKITAKYFEKEYQERFTPETVLSKSFGIGGGSQVEVKAQHLTLKTYLSLDHARPGNRVSLVAEIALPAKMHIYAPGVQGYRPVSFAIEETPGLKIHDAEYPKAQKLFLPVIKEEVPVYVHAVRITRDITIAANTRPQKVELKGVFEYQACDDKMCYLPDKIPFTFNLEVEPQDRTRVPEEIRKKAPLQ
jgi:hypothetical protein